MADLEEDNSYLQPGFDPSSLTMPKLRNILFQHDIAYPSGAKKAQLVEVFESQLRPKAKRILAQQARVKRTSMGIQDMSSQSSVDHDHDAEEELEPEPEPIPVRKTTRKSSAAPSNASTTRSRTSRKSTKATETSNGDELESVTGRSSRYSTATPAPETPSESGASMRGGRRKTRLSDFDPPAPVQAQIKEEEAEEEEEGDGGPTPKGPSPFTMDNPFQSASSPAEEAMARKRSPTKKVVKKRPASSSSRIQVKSEEDDAAATPVAATSRKLRESSARLSNGTIKASRSRTVSLEPGEEFTQEEQEELEEEEEASGQALMPARQRHSGSGGGAKLGPLVILTTILAGVGGWWRQEKLAAGYCGVGSSGQTLALSNSDVQLPEFLSGLQPQCEPCPQHAYCYIDFEARCEPGFVLQQHPLALGGLVPIAPTCEPDSEKARKVKSVADRAIEELREQKAKYECGERDGEGNTVTSAGLSEETLKARVSARRRRGMSEAEFEDLWRGAMGDVLEREEITRDKEGRRRSKDAHGDAAGSTAALVLSTRSLARLPLLCAVRRSARLSLARHRVPLALVILATAGAIWARARLTASRTDRARVPGLVATALDRVATQAALHELGRASEPYISMAGLRDDLLRDEFSAQRRDKIWTRVKAVVEMNANVRAGVREARSGDVSRVWEWIGPLPQQTTPLVDGGEYYNDGTGSRRQSGRFSFGGLGSEESLLKSGSASASRSSSTGMGRGGNVDVKKELGGSGEVTNDDGTPSIKSEKEGNRNWDEGRPAF